MKSSASWPLVIQSLRPFRTKPSASRWRAWSARRRRCPIRLRTGRRRRPCAPRATGGSGLESSVPQRSSALTTSVFCTSTSTPTDGSTRDSASTASTAWKNVAPAPPCASGISMPMTPRSNSLSMSCGGCAPGRPSRGRAGGSRGPRIRRRCRETALVVVKTRQSVGGSELSARVKHTAQVRSGSGFWHLGFQIC